MARQRSEYSKAVDNIGRQIRRINEYQKKLDLSTKEGQFQNRLLQESKQKNYELREELKEKHRELREAERKGDSLKAQELRDNEKDLISERKSDSLSTSTRKLAEVKVKTELADMDDEENQLAGKLAKGAVKDMLTRITSEFDSIVGHYIGPSSLDRAACQKANTVISKIKDMKNIFQDEMSSSVNEGLSTLLKILETCKMTPGAGGVVYNPGEDINLEE